MKKNGLKKKQKVKFKDILSGLFIIFLVIIIPFIMYLIAVKVINMTSLIVIISIIVVCSYVFDWCRSRVTSYKKAKSLEEAGEYKEACYQYAYTIFLACGSTSFQKDAHERIRYLWEKFGPFDYNDKAQSIKNKSKLDQHEALVRIIEYSLPLPKVKEQFK